MDGIDRGRIQGIITAFVLRDRAKSGKALVRMAGISLLLGGYSIDLPHRQLGYKLHSNSMQYASLMDCFRIAYQRAIVQACEKACKLSFEFSASSKCTFKQRR